MEDREKEKGRLKLNDIEAGDASEIAEGCGPYRVAKFECACSMMRSAIGTSHWGCPSSEEQIPQVIGKAEKAYNEMELLERNFTRPRRGIGRRCLCANPSHRFEFPHKRN